jgi:hypothetical protein
LARAPAFPMGRSRLPQRAEAIDPAPAIAGIVR